jgi:uncharacterized MAPEG superfamily protein
MSASLTALLGFAAWAVLLIFVVFLYRTAVVFAGRKAANAWQRAERPPADEPAIITRIGHAHLNTVENLPIFAAIVAAAAAAGKLPVTDTVALWVVYARIAQSVTHLIGTTHWLVVIRANFFAVQLLLYAYMIWGLLA